MSWKRTVLIQTTTTGIHHIVRLPEVKGEVFLQTLSEEVFPMALLPGEDRMTNPVAQALWSDEAEGVADTWGWAIYFNGLHRPEVVREKCEAMYKSVRDKLEAVGVRTPFRLETLAARWEAAP